MNQQTNIDDILPFKSRFTN